MKARYNVLVIGAGNIGAFFDTPNSDKVLTHAHAFSKHKGFNLCGFYDVNMRKSQKAASIWGGRAFTCIENAFKEERIDIACVAVPDDYHYGLLKELLTYPIKLVFAEKPLAKTMKEAEEIVNLYHVKNIGLTVNHCRRFIPELKKIRDNFNKKLYGDYVAGSGYYGKGLFHNGSHLIDLLRYIIGEIKSSYTIDYRTDFYKDDPSISAVLTFEDKKKFFLQHIDCDLYTVFEIDLFFEKKRIRITNSGFSIEVHEIKTNNIFRGYKYIIMEKEFHTSFATALYHVVDNIYNYLTKGKNLICSGADGLETISTCTRIRDGKT